MENPFKPLSLINWPLAAGRPSFKPSESSQSIRQLTKTRSVVVRYHNLRGGIIHVRLNSMSLEF